MANRCVVLCWLALLANNLIGLIIGDPDAICFPTITQVNGTHVPLRRLCRGQLIFAEDFNEFKTDLWHHEVTLGGGGVNKFYFYFPGEIFLCKVQMKIFLELGISMVCE